MEGCFDFGKDVMIEHRVMVSAYGATDAASTTGSCRTKPDETASRSPHRHVKKRALNTLSLTAMIFFVASGGPFGIEGIVADVGPLLAMLGYLVFPFFWSVPEGLMTAELSSAFPENAGSVAWCATAFGPGPAYVRGILSWLSGVIDNSLYPVLFADYAGVWHESLAEPHARVLLIVGFTVSLTYVSYRGLDVAGKVAVAVCVFSLLPFVAMCALGLPRIDPSKCRALWTTTSFHPTESSNWVLYLSMIMWNLNDFDGAASFAAEVENPGTTYPRAMMTSIALVVVSYVVPIFISTTATTSVPYSEYEDGTFTLVAEELGGQWMGGWMVVAATLSNVGLFLAEMGSDSYQLMGMAEHGMVPAFMGEKSRYGTPIFAIVISVAVILFLALSSTFEKIIMMVNFIYAVAETVELAAFVKLRYSHPDLPRPYRVPVSALGAAAMMVAPYLIILTVLFTSDWDTWMISGAVTSLGILSYFFMGLCKRRRWLTFMSFEAKTPPIGSNEPFDAEAESEDIEEETRNLLAASSNGGSNTSTV